MATERERLLLKLEMIDTEQQMFLLQMLRRRRRPMVCNGGVVVLEQEVKPCKMPEMM
ncbi:hypothetical protein ABVT39_014035 [Epinephelus coioides]